MISFPFISTYMYRVEGVTKMLHTTLFELYFSIPPHIHVRLHVSQVHYFLWKKNLVIWVLVPELL